MDLISLTPEWSEQTCHLYNSLTSELPHCFPAEPEEVEIVSDPLRLKAPFRIGIVDKGQLRGFALGGINLENTVRIALPGDGVLNGIFCDSMAAARILLGAVIRQLRDSGAHRMVAFDAGEQHHCLPFFNGGFGACSEDLAVTIEALARSGFQLAARELNMTFELEKDYSQQNQIDTENPTFPEGILARWLAETDDRLEIQAMDGDCRIGSCVGHRMSARQKHPNAKECGYITWLGVDPDYQGNGIGRALLRQMLARMEEGGMRRIFLTTGSYNWRARLLYESMGFLIVGQSISMVRE